MFPMSMEHPTPANRRFVGPGMATVGEKVFCNSVSCAQVISFGPGGGVESLAIAAVVSSANRE
ncbi:MAG: hypothetical protein RL716_1159 [Actinomycetota bacterium]